MAVSRLLLLNHNERTGSTNAFEYTKKNFLTKANVWNSRFLRIQKYKVDSKSREIAKLLQVHFRANRKLKKLKYWLRSSTWERIPTKGNSIQFFSEELTCVSIFVNSKKICVSWRKITAGTKVNGISQIACSDFVCTQNTIDDELPPYLVRFNVTDAFLFYCCLDRTAHILSKLTAHHDQTKMNFPRISRVE